MAQDPIFYKSFKLIRFSISNMVPQSKLGDSVSVPVILSFPIIFKFQYLPSSTNNSHFESCRYDNTKIHQRQGIMEATGDKCGKEVCIHYQQCGEAPLLAWDGGV